MVPGKSDIAIITWSHDFYFLENLSNMSFLENPKCVDIEGNEL